MTCETKHWELFWYCRVLTYKWLFVVIIICVANVDNDGRLPFMNGDFLEEGWTATNASVNQHSLLIG